MSNLFRIELILRWAKVNMFKFFKQMFFKIFCEFHAGCPDDVDASFKLAETFDSSEPGNSPSIKLYTDSLTKFFVIL